VTIVQRLIDEHPGVRARLLIGDQRISQNPKLTNIWKGWEAAAGAWIIIADSNVLMPRDYVQQLLTAWEPDTGLVCSPPIGCRPGGFWAELECAFLNTYQARWQYFADSMGSGFAQGKTMLWRRDELNSVGLSALARDAAEDAAATKLVRSVGKRVRLVDGPFKQPLGQRTAAEVWRRQLRWARLRRDAFVECYAIEIFSTSWLAIAAAAVAALALGMFPMSGMIPVFAVWYGSEAVLAFSAQWQLSVRSPIAWLLRDSLLPVLWAAGWFGSKVQWRGTPIPITNQPGTVANLGGA
jgi:ceramide glucosyltransferase